MLSKIYITTVEHRNGVQGGGHGFAEFTQDTPNACFRFKVDRDMDCI